MSEEVWKLVRWSRIQGQSNNGVDFCSEIGKIVFNTCIKI